MKNKTILAIFAVFLIAGSLAAVYAEDASLGDLKFEIPTGYKVTSSNDTAVVLTNDQKTIIVSTNITGNDTVNSYLSAKGFKFNETIDGETSVTGNVINGNFNYNENTYSKDKGYAVAYLVQRDGKDISVIGIDNDYDSDFGGSSDVSNPVNDVLKEVMLRK